ncbi:MAG: hypothetical protein OXL96_00965 [Candidatus Poribacteria bacterium]|nr:hypothetical protein [Candidatus Poribacteria bacterium]
MTDLQDDPEDRDKTANETEKSPSKLRMGIGRRWASIKKRPTFWAVIALCVLTTFFNTFTLFVLTGDVRRSIEKKAYSYKVVAPEDENLTTTLKIQGVLGWRVVHARRATKRGTSGRTTTPIYELILEREYILR